MVDIILRDSLVNFKIVYVKTNIHYIKCLDIKNIFMVCWIRKEYKLENERCVRYDKKQETRKKIQRYR